MLSDRAALRAAHLILASGSPRRVEIFNEVLQLEARVVPSTFPENLDKSLYTPTEYVQENARLKAMEVYTRLMSEAEGPPRLVVGADTVVVLEGEILEKPKSEEHAREMLRRLSGGSHEVSTGVALIYGPAGADASDVAPHTEMFVETTKVEFGELSSETIDAYVESGEPMDKAGAYGIQGVGGSFVSSITGCYFNVVGFPMHRFCTKLDLKRLTM
ncbi:hypothetical protein AB1Y20_006874 [Prymnesium parvum]|uniref:Nucleic acid-binding protein asmtl n=1 Tax=Prymnesium parvum TaxID=97485 RepID=A0AB34IZ88_PRYPA